MIFLLTFSYCYRVYGAIIEPYQALLQGKQHFHIRTKLIVNFIYIISDMFFNLSRYVWYMYVRTCLSGPRRCACGFLRSSSHDARPGVDVLVCVKLCVCGPTWPGASFWGVPFSWLGIRTCVSGCVCLCEPDTVQINYRIELPQPRTSP